MDPRDLDRHDAPSPSIDDRIEQPAKTRQTLKSPSLFDLISALFKPVLAAPVVVLGLLILVPALSSLVLFSPT